jgi:hypothetical protein
MVPYGNINKYDFKQYLRDRDLIKLEHYSD